MLWRMRVDTLGEKEMNYAERAETVNDNDVEDEGMVDELRPRIVLHLLWRPMHLLWKPVQLL